MRDKGTYILIGLSLLLIALLIIGQVFSLFNYELAVSLGLQESEEEVGRVGIAFAKGFAFGDTVFYLPMLIIGVVGLVKKLKWAIFVMIGAMGISIYWPVVHLYAIFVDQEAITLHPDKYISYSITLALIIIYGWWGLRHIAVHFEQLTTKE